jgi:hypothetical protein
MEDYKFILYVVHFTLSLIPVINLVFTAKPSFRYLPTSINT